VTARRLLLLACAASACVSSDSVPCGELVCPADTVCTQLTQPATTICATDEQLAPCVGKGDGDTCVIEGISVARCYDGVCQDGGCGNGRMEDAEVCDDGNRASGDGCAADCLSTEICGNSIPDLAAEETCDDGNHLDHDGCSSTCQSEQPRWIARLRRPANRTEAVIAYDPLRDRVVLFSGREPLAGAERLNDAWEWDGAAWTEFHGPTPLGRIRSAMAFDGTGVMVYGGGPGFGPILGDTWVFDGARWTERTDLAVTPGPRQDHLMAYDSRRRRVVLFGGSMFGDPFEDTWEWDGTAWSKITTASHPPGRSKGLMTYDPVHGVIVLAGGSGSVSGVCSPGCNDTWVYDGVDWQDVTPAGLVPADNSFHGMAWDTGSQRVLAVGQDIDDHRVLAWDGASWTDVPTGTPPFHQPGESVVATPTSIVMTAAGGNDMWLWQSGAWSEPPTPGANAMQYNPFANDHARGAIVMLDGSGKTWTLSRTGWTQITTGPPPAVRSRVGITYDPVNRNVVMFGGLGATSTILGETWVWDGSAWSQKTSGPAPSARIGAAMAFDGTHVTLFGGSTTTSLTGAPLADTWTWNGTSWSPASPATSPPAMAGAAAGYDPVRDELVLFGNGQTWTYDGSTWTQKTVTAGPAPRTSVPLVWNAARQRLVLGGGEGAIDMWEWDGKVWSQAAISGAPPARGAAGWAASLDGDGVLLYGGTAGMTFYDDVWELRYDSGSLDDRCDGSDVDGDMQVGCDDADCWQTCTPSCPPQTSCPAIAPRCGDGACDDAYETCQTCAMDCTCATLCGDFLCAPGDTSCPGDCP
jgi:cysteine-rich repeat protein